MSLTMRFSSAFFALTLSLGFSIFAPAASYAGMITGVQMFGPQAGTGTGLGTVSVPVVFTNPADINNDNQVGGGLNDNNITVPIKRFDNIGYIDIVFNVTPTNGTTEYKVFENVDNNTFIPWSSYTMELGFDFGANFRPGIAGDGLDFDFPDYDTFPSSSEFATVIPITEDFLLFTNGLQMTGSETYQFRIDVSDLPQGFTSFTIRQTPVAIPEPGMFIAAAFAGCGLLLRRRLF